MIARLGTAVGGCLYMAGALAALPWAAGDGAHPVCKQAMQLASAMFVSTAPRWEAPLAIAADLPSKLVWGAERANLAGGGALTSSAVFDTITPDGAPVFWASSVAQGALRVVISTQPMGWRGDMYSAYLLDAAVAPQDFVRSMEAGSGSTAPYQSVVEDAWRPPWVFQPHAPQPLWLIDAGQPFLALADWRVFTSAQAQPVCTIAFKPAGQSVVPASLPALQQLVQQLQEALGPGSGEGTLQPTARIRMEAQHVVANAVWRPWALADSQVYNSRSEVDAGLQAWAQGHAARRQLYGEIRQTYPVAERALAAHYASAHALAPAQAREVAAWATDLVYRAFFVFAQRPQGTRDEGVRHHPWPRSPERRSSD